MKKNPNKQFARDIAKLIDGRVDFRKKSLAMSQIIKRIGVKFAKDILSHVKPAILYGEKRYLLEDIKRYLNKTNVGRDIFIELVGGQSCFLPPVNKHRQGKLFIKP